nr:hypothetical protein [Kiritimatiellia bacterium]
DLQKVMFYYRIYDPWLGKFLSLDPIEEQGGINLYGIGGNDLINKFDLWGLKTLAEDLEAHAFLQMVASGCLMTGRPITGKFLNMYLDEKNSGSYSLTHSEIMKIMLNEGFRFKLGRTAGVLMQKEGQGNIKSDIKDEHTFDPDFDGDLWSAFNDLRFKLLLNGCVTLTDEEYRFKGKLTVVYDDTFTFGDPKETDRTPFFRQWYLPDKYQYITEQRFYDLEQRGWVNKFDVTGSRTAFYTIVVNKHNLNDVEVRRDPYNK